MHNKMFHEVHRDNGVSVPPHSLSLSVFLSAVFVNFLEHQIFLTQSGMRRDAIPHGRDQRRAKNTDLHRVYYLAYFAFSFYKNLFNAFRLCCRFFGRSTPWKRSPFFLRRSKIVVTVKLEGWSRAFTSFHCSGVDTVGILFGLTAYGAATVSAKSF